MIIFLSKCIYEIYNLNNNYMPFICKLCRKDLVDSAQCITCLDIICIKCSQFCKECNTNTCNPCSKKQVNHAVGILRCTDCKVILCSNCSYIMDYLNKEDGYYAKYCIKNGCYAGHEDTLVVKSSIMGELKLKQIFPNMADYINKLKKENTELRKENTELRTEIDYMPNGKGYLEAKKHFEEISVPEIQDAVDNEIKN